MSIMDIIHPEFREIVRERRQARLNGEQAQSEYELKMITRSGAERWVNSSVGVIELGRETNNYRDDLRYHPPKTGRGRTLPDVAAGREQFRLHRYGNAGG